MRNFTVYYILLAFLDQQLIFRPASKIISGVVSVPLAKRVKISFFASKAIHLSTYRFRFGTQPQPIAKISQDYSILSNDLNFLVTEPTVSYNTTKLLSLSRGP